MSQRDHNQSPDAAPAFVIPERRRHLFRATRIENPDMAGLIGGTTGINPSTYENLVSIINDCNHCTPAAVALLATLVRSVSSMPRNRPNFDRHVHISEIPDLADVEASRSSLEARISVEMIKASTVMEQLTGVELSAPIVSPQQMMLAACIKTVQNATIQHELEAQHLAVEETKKVTKAILKRAKLTLSKATSEKVKAKSTLEQLLGSPNKQFVEYEHERPCLDEIKKGRDRAKEQYATYYATRVDLIGQ